MLQVLPTQLSGLHRCGAGAELCEGFLPRCMAADIACLVVLLYGFVGLTSLGFGVQLFARQLWPGWTSWGNDALHFQRLPYFQVPQEQGPAQPA